jgi:hypothetical protein
MRYLECAQCRAPHAIHVVFGDHVLIRSRVLCLTARSCLEQCCRAAFWKGEYISSLVVCVCLILEASVRIFYAAMRFCLAAEIVMAARGARALVVHACRAVFVE